jgi:hypothetical protein
MLLVVACGGKGHTVRPEPDRDEDYELEVRNDNFYPATIYAYRDGYRRRIGEVAANETKTFLFHWSGTDLRFQIRFLAVGCIFSERLPVTRGDDLQLIVEASDHHRASRALCGPGAVREV